MNDTAGGDPRPRRKVRKTLDPILPLYEKRRIHFGTFGGFSIRGTSFAVDSRVVGWRITVLKEDGGLPYECWVRHGQIYSIEFETAPPWDHQSRFVIGGPAQGIDRAMGAAILHAVLQWSRPGTQRGS
jgi:hypothetical protein